MSKHAKPGSVTAVLVLLILIAVYQLVVGATAIVGAVAIDATNLADEAPAEAGAMLEAAEDNIAGIYFGAALCLVYAALATALAVMVGRGTPRARPWTIAVNTVFAVAGLALMIPMIYGLGAVLSAVFAFVVVGLMFTSGARSHFAATGAPTTG